MNLETSLYDSYCTLHFNNFFSSRNLAHSLKKNINSIGTVRANRKNMQTFLPDKNLKRGDCRFKTCKNVIYVKWMDNRAVTLIGSNAANLNQMSSVLRRQKGVSSKSAVPCPIIVKKYNQSMDGVDLCDQYTAAYHLDRRTNLIFRSISKHAEGVLIVRLVRLKIAHLSFALYVIYLCAFRRRETVFCFTTKTQTNEQTVLNKVLNI